MLFSTRCRKNPRLRMTVNVEKYLEVLSDMLIKSARDMYGQEAWIYQQDNASRHTANRCQDIREKNIAVSPWPAQCPDLNPIENL